MFIFDITIKANHLFMNADKEMVHGVVGRDGNGAVSSNMQLMLTDVIYVEETARSAAQFYVPRWAEQSSTDGIWK